MIAAGGMRLETPQSDGDLDRIAKVLLHAYEKGINYFDTAPLYCGDRSEEIVGRAIGQMKPGSYYVSTKCSAVDGAELRKSLERSLKRLGVDRIHFFHIWCLLKAEEWEARLKGGAVDAAFQAKEEGLVEHVVFSTHLSGDETARVIAESSFEGVTLGFNAVNFPYRERALAAAGRAKLGVVTMNPLGGGLIPRHAERFDFIRSPNDPDVVTAALRFNLSHPQVTAALVGFNNTAEVDQAVAALDGFEMYDGSFVAKIKNQITDQFNGLCTGCGYCLPCPAGVPIPKFMDVHNILDLQDESQDVYDRLNWHWNLDPKDAGACVACGECEKRCTQHLPIIERLHRITMIQPKA